MAQADPPCPGIDLPLVISFLIPTVTSHPGTWGLTAVFRKRMRNTQPLAIYEMTGSSQSTAGVALRPLS